MFTWHFFWSRIHIITAWIASCTTIRLFVIIKSLVAFLFKRKNSALVPSVLTVILSYKCNYSCIMCQKNSKDKNVYTPDPQDINIDKFQNLIDQYGRYLSVVKLHGGEPLFYKNFDRIIDILDDAKLKYTIITNGSLLTPDISEKILKNCLLVSISIDTIDPDLYGRIRVGGNLTNVLNNISSLTELKKKYNIKSPYINVCVTAFKYNLAGLKDVINFCAQAGIPTISVNEGWFYNTPYLTDDDFIKNHPELVKTSVRDALLLAEERNIEVRLNSAVLTPNGIISKSDLNEQKKENCFNFYISAVITPELDFKLCPMSEPIGNLNETSLPSIWNDKNSPVVKARIDFKHARLPQTCRYCLQFNEEFDQQEDQFSYVNFQERSHYWEVED